VKKPGDSVVEKGKLELTKPEAFVRRRERFRPRGVKIGPGEGEGPPFRFVEPAGAEDPRSRIATGAHVSAVFCATPSVAASEFGLHKL